MYPKAVVETNQLLAKIEKQQEIDWVWKLFFDEECSREGMSSWILLVPLVGLDIPLSFQLQFDATNNVVENEALILSLERTKNMGVKIITFFGDSKLVVLQIKKVFTTKYRIMRSYQNVVWDIIENYFDAFNITSIHREDNQ